MTIHEFITESNAAPVINEIGISFRPEIHCIDGFHMSVQASEGHDCYPRQKSDSYTYMEIGFPSDVEELIMEFAESPEQPCMTVYGYVPIATIDKVLEKHGGIDVQTTFNLM